MMIEGSDDRAGGDFALDYKPSSQAEDADCRKRRITFDMLPMPVAASFAII